MQNVKKYNKDINKLLSNPQELNSYSYAANNPVIYVDPNGKLRVHYGDATEEQRKTFDSGLKQLTRIVENNQEIKDYFNSFKVDIVDVLTNEKSGPDVNLGGFYNWLTNLKDSRGAYYGLTNNIGFGDSGLESEEEVQNTLIHELGHYANDVGKRWGELNPDISSFKTTAKSDDFNYSGNDIKIVDYLDYDFLNRGRWSTLLKDSYYGYAAQLILFGKIK